MLMIIAHHYALYGVHQSYDSNKIDSYYAYGTSLNRAISECFLPGGVVGVGIFFLIAGYFGIQSDKIRVSSVIKTVLFYSLFFAFLAAVLHNYDFLNIPNTSIERKYLEAIFPILYEEYWFASVYVFISFMKPAINDVIRQVKNKAGIVIFAMIVSYVFMRYEMPAYYGLFNGLIFYSIGAYIKLFEPEIRKVPKICFIMLGICGWLFYVMFNKAMYTKYDSAIAIAVMGTISAIGFMLWFCQQETFSNHIINRIAKTTFGIYLFHENPMVRELLWGRILKVAEVQFVSNYFIVYAVLSIICIFVVGSGFDFIREEVFKLIDIWITRINNWVMHEKVR